MDQRERWQALQSHLSAARGFVDAGDRAKALEAVDAALAIDPHFLAAHSLRDHILMPAMSGPIDAPLQGAASAQRGETPSPQPQPVAPVQPQSHVSTDGYARFEARAKRRRVDRRLDAARIALEHRRLKDAEAALDEIIELDPNLPELAELATAFDQLRRDSKITHRGPWVAAAASFAIVVLGASWLQQPHPLESTQIPSVATPVVVATSMPTVETEIVDAAVATTGADAATRDSGLGTRPQLVTAESSSVIRAPATPNAEIRFASPEPQIPVPERQDGNPERQILSLERQVSNPERHIPNPEFRIPSRPAPVSLATTPEPISAAVEPQPPAPLPPPPSPAAASAIAAAIATSPAPTLSGVPVSTSSPTRAVESADDLGLVKQVLQRYRTAYDGLDAQSARAVYPAVNQAALARAFDNLQSQTLTFDACDVQLRGEAATATCRGNARYVPKIGSREPRTEPRTWNFTLRKAGTDWKIDSARADR